jgi:hypothetical protein
MKYTATIYFTFEIFSKPPAEPSDADKGVSSAYISAITDSFIQLLLLI